MPSGTYASGGQVVCTECPTGTYATTFANAACNDCPEDFFCSSKSDDPIPCPTGNLNFLTKTNMNPHILF